MASTRSKRKTVDSPAVTREEHCLTDPKALALAWRAGRSFNRLYVGMIQSLVTGVSNPQINIEFDEFCSTAPSLTSYLTMQESLSVAASNARSKWNEFAQSSRSKEPKSSRWI